MFLSSFPIVFSISSCVDGWAGKGGAAKGAQVAMGRPCLETKRWQVGKADASLGPTRRRTQAGKTGNKMGRRFRGICQRARTKVGDLGGRQQRLADGRSWICEESEGARRRRFQIRNSAAFIILFQATAAIFPGSSEVRIIRRGSLSLSRSLDLLFRNLDLLFCQGICCSVQGFVVS